jgi:class 3 adenylate cyclase
MPSAPLDVWYARSGDVSIADRVVGEGERDFLFVHGFAGNLEAEAERAEMVAWIDRITQFARLITFDRRGTVRSLGLEVKIGLHTGECERVDGKIGGLPVNIGARVAANAGAGEVVVSSTVKDLVAGSEIQFDDRGEHELKGVPGSWRLYSVSP